MFRQKFPLLQNFKRWKNNGYSQLPMYHYRKTKCKVSICFKKTLGHKSTYWQLTASSHSSWDLLRYPLTLLDWQQEESKKLVSYGLPLLPSHCEGIEWCFSNFPMHVNHQEVLLNVRFTNSLMGPKRLHF